MRTTASLAKTTLLLLCAALGGCVISQRTSYEDVERAKITFGSERAGRIFYEALSRLPAESKETGRDVYFFVVVNATRKVVTGPNRHFNHAVARCDTNKDGTITDDEAQIFSSSVNAGSSGSSS